MRYKVLNSTQLKWIAMISMTFDHVGMAVFPQYILFRIIGRLAFPIFCFLLVNGYYHTHDYSKYVLRLFTFALISEIPFDLFVYGRLFDTAGQNIFFTLFIGLIMIKCIEFIRLFRNIEFKLLSLIAEGLIVITACLTAFTIRSDYSFCGILIIYWFYLYRSNKFMLVLFQAFTNMKLLGGIQGFAVFSLVPIFMYNGKKGWNKMKYLFYAFYPIHLFVIYCIVKII